MIASGCIPKHACGVPRSASCLASTSVCCEPLCSAEASPGGLTSGCHLPSLLIQRPLSISFSKPGAHCEQQHLFWPPSMKVNFEHSKGTTQVFRPLLGTVDKLSVGAPNCSEVPFSDLEFVCSTVTGKTFQLLRHLTKPCLYHLNPCRSIGPRYYVFSLI